MDADELNNHNNFSKFIKIQKQLHESFSIGLNAYNSVLEPDELFPFLNENFEHFYIKENILLILKFVDRCMKQWIPRVNCLENDVGIPLVYFFAEHNQCENNINIVVQIVYQIMCSICNFEYNDVALPEKLLRVIVQTIPLIKSRAVVANCIACIQKFIEMYPQSRENLKPLWSFLSDQLQNNLNNGTTSDTEIDILMQLIDDFKSLQSNFHEEPLLMSTIQHLLKSEERKFRKCGYYLLRKLIDYVVENMNNAKMWISSDDIQQIEQCWMLYITLLENLEEEQSHLILPSLENFIELITRNRLPSHWLNILYVRILTHKNNLVVRRSIEFILGNFSCGDLPVEITKYLLRAINSNLLFNYEGYFLKRENFSSFLKGDAKCVLSLLPEVENWKPIPLYMWLESCKEQQIPISLTFEDILKISSCVRTLQNCSIRKMARKLCEELFEEIKEKMSMKEYVTYIETLYNSGDKYLEHTLFFKKVSSLIPHDQERSIFKQRFYDIFTNSKWENHELILFLKLLPLEQFGWLKFAPFKLKIPECDRDWIKNVFELNLDSLDSCDISTVISAFKISLLGSQSDDNLKLNECVQAAISYYIYQRNDFKIETADTLQLILNSGVNHKEVIGTFSEKLLDNNEEIIDFWYIDELLKYNSKRVLESISRYLSIVVNKAMIKKYAFAVWKTNGFDRSLVKENTDFIKQVTDEFLQVLTSQGDKRIEEAFCFNHFKLKKCISESTCTAEYIIPIYNKQLVWDLLKYHTDITKKKPRYYENSTQHRAKLRIATCMYYLTMWSCNTQDILDQFWNILLNENNQSNVVYIYEYILGHIDHRESSILQKLREAQKLTPSQQVSIISVAYVYIKKHFVTATIENTIVYSLLSLTMGASFKTRLFAQIVLYQLFNDNFLQIEESESLLQSIKDAMGSKLPEYLTNIRLYIFDTAEEIDFIPVIFNITNVPFDEFLCLSYNFIDWYPSLKDKLDYILSDQNWYVNKFKGREADDTTAKDTINFTIQRKLNPVGDLVQPHDLIAYPIKEKSAEMFVVASLIDKLPNLGGIARTCEVLGIKNLVMDSKMHTEKDDFKNLSMTAEKTLNILEVKPKDLQEFLITKKLEGYNIVGAEQTCNSENFNNFQFPKKCVLLLGHEKHGIPAPLLGLLDAAVEIPQRGQVRSLNVHVTGALFIWEYCKQHLIEKS